MLLPINNGIFWFACLKAKEAQKKTNIKMNQLFTLPSNRNKKLLVASSSYFTYIWFIGEKRGRISLCEMLSQPIIIAGVCNNMRNHCKTFFYSWQ